MDKREGTPSFKETYHLPSCSLEHTHAPMTWRYTKTKPPTPHPFTTTFLHIKSGYVNVRTKRKAKGSRWIHTMKWAHTWIGLLLLTITFSGGIHDSFSSFFFFFFFFSIFLFYGIQTTSLDMPSHHFSSQMISHLLPS